MLSIRNGCGLVLRPLVPAVFSQANKISPVLQCQQRAFASFKERVFDVKSCDLKNKFSKISLANPVLQSGEERFPTLRNFAMTEDAVKEMKSFGRDKDINAKGPDGHSLMYQVLMYEKTAGRVEILMKELAILGAKVDYQEYPKLRELSKLCADDFLGWRLESRFFVRSFKFLPVPELCESLSVVEKVALLENFVNAGGNINSQSYQGKSILKQVLNTEDHHNHIKELLENLFRLGAKVNEKEYPLQSLFQDLLNLKKSIDWKKAVILAFKGCSNIDFVVNKRVALQGLEFYDGPDADELHQFLVNV